MTPVPICCEYCGTHGLTIRRTHLEEEGDLWLCDDCRVDVVYCQRKGKDILVP